MLYHLLTPLAADHIFFNLFNYVTVRAAGAMITAVIISFLLGPAIINWLRVLRFGQVVRSEGPETHLKKAGTPTMGGVMIIIGTVISTLLWAKLDNPYTLITLGVLVWLGALGFLDDYLKVVRRRTEGLVGRYKLVGQGAIGLIVAGIMIFTPFSPISANFTNLPLLADYYLKISTFMFIPWVMFIVAGTSNAVNLTDGLDGLAGGLTAIAAATFGVFAYVIGRVDTSAYLGFFYLPGAGELSIFCIALTGATLGFLWFNAHPAEVFMGDTGSLALGGAMGAMMVLCKKEFVLPIVGGIFFLESISVIMQTGYFKFSRKMYGEGRRIFRMAPIHHHFELCGWAESKIVTRAYIAAIILAILALTTFKVR